VTFKAAILLYRRDGATHEEFERWWLDGHQPLARQLPGLRRAVFNVVRQPGEGDPDGIAELWFDSREAFDAAYASEIGATVVADSMANVSARRRVFVDEHAVHGG
jgi:uncharacterized protein (TIGR02118 family)